MTSSKSVNFSQNFDSNQLEGLLAAEPRLMSVAARPPRIMVRGSGSYLWDHTGTRYLDFVQGWAVNSLGHSPPEVTAALREQSEILLTPSPAFHNLPQLQFARTLADHACMASVHFANSGAEANEAALKLARKWGRLKRGGAYQIITTEGSFHGRTLALMAASGKPGWDELFPPKMPGFVKVPFGDAAAAEASVAAQTVAIMVEPIQGEAGVVVPPSGYLRELRAVCDRHDLLLMCDEVQTGIGRTGALFASEHDAMKPDILTLGKGLGGGVPVSAIVANSRADCFAPGDQGGTYNGNPLLVAVAQSVFAVVSEPAFLARVRAAAEYLQGRLSGLCKEHGFTVRGRGLLLALVLPDERAERLVQACFSRGLLVNAPRSNLLRLMPSLRVSNSEIDEMVTILEQASYA